MSNLSKRVVKSFTVLTAVATILSLSGFAVLAPNWANAAVPSDYGLTEGDTISAAGSDDPDVYIVNERGYKRLFLNPAIFNFYGHLGGFAQVKNVSAVARDAFPTSGLFRNCETGDQKVYGVEVTGEDTGILHWVNTSGAQAVADDPNFFSKVFCINNNEFNWYAKGSDYSSVNQVPNYSRAPGAPAPGVGLSASLASSNPASGTLVAGQALADLAHFNISGSGLVTMVELQRLGISGDTTLSNVYLFVNGRRASDAGSVATGKVTFNNANGLFTAPAVVSVRSDILSGTSGQTVGIAITKVNSTNVSASGNLHTVAATPGDLAAMSFAAPTGPGNIDPQNDVNVWQSVMSVTGKDVWLKRLTLREIGSINYSDIRNFRLFADGVQIASVANLDSDGYAHFVLSGSGHKLMTGSRTLRVQADVIGGSSRTFSFSLRGSYDLEVVDSNYNVNINATGTYPATTSSSTVNAGSMTVVKAPDSPSSDVVKGGTDAVLAKFTMTAFGEAIKVETLTVMATTSNAAVGSLRNGRLLINGQQYGSTSTLDTTPSVTGTAFTVNYTVQPGSIATVEVRADIFDNDGTDSFVNGNTITATLKEGSNNAQRVSSSGLINVPTANQAGNARTVGVGSMSLSKFNAYANQTVTVPRSGQKLGHYVLNGNSSEAVNVNTFDVSFVETGATFGVAQLNNVWIKYGSNSTSPKSTVTASTSYSINFALGQNQTMDVEIYGDIAASATGALRTSLNVLGTNAVSGGSSVSTGTIQGQTMTVGSGSLVTSLGANNPVARLAAANSTVDALQVNFQATNDNFTIKEVKFRVANANAASVISSVRLNGPSGEFLASQPVALVASGSYYANFTGLNVSVPNNSDVNLTAQLQLGNVGVGAATSSANAALTMTSAKVSDSTGTESTNDTDRDGNAIYVHKANPVLAELALPSSALTGGTKTISKFSVAGDAGTIGWKKAIFSITKTAANTITSGSYRMFEDGVDVTSAGAFAETAGADGTTKTTTFIWTAERQVSSAKTYDVRATLGGTIADGASFITSINNPSSTAVPNTYAVVAATSASFVWTDRSSSAHAQTTPDWINDHLVKTLPISQALTN